MSTGFADEYVSSISEDVASVAFWYQYKNPALLTANNFPTVNPIAFPFTSPELYALNA